MSLNDLSSYFAAKEQVSGQDIIRLIRGVEEAADEMLIQAEVKAKKLAPDFDFPKVERTITAAVGEITHPRTPLAIDNGKEGVVKFKSGADIVLAGSSLNVVFSGIAFTKIPLIMVYADYGGGLSTTYLGGYYQGDLVGTSTGYYWDDITTNGFTIRNIDAANPINAYWFAIGI